MVNANEIVYFRSMRDHLGAMNLGRSSFPNRYKWFCAVYQDAIKEKYSYLYMSFNAETKQELVLRTRIFYNIEVPIIYL